VPPALNTQKNLKPFSPTQKLRHPNSDLQLLLLKPFWTFLEDEFLYFIIKVLFWQSSKFVGISKLKQEHL
jgi:hypothetical protein